MNEVMGRPAQQQGQEPPPEAPVCRVWGWRMCHFNGAMWMQVNERYEDHPLLGSGTKLQTTNIVWSDQDLKMVRTKSTTYKLMGPGEW